MKTKQIPLIVMLSAGAVTSISTRLMHYELETALWILLAVLIVFYIAGCLIKRTIDSFEAANSKSEDESEGEGENADVPEEGEMVEKEPSEETQEPEDVQM